MQHTGNRADERRYIMYKYIECNRSESGEHFRKFQHLDEVKSHIDSLHTGNCKEDSLCSKLETAKCSSQSHTLGVPDVHVYRIKDITDAINTSVILDLNQKEDYNRKLTDDKQDFDADASFRELCQDVGECDIY